MAEFGTRGIRYSEEFRSRRRSEYIRESAASFGDFRRLSATFGTSRRSIVPIAHAHARTGVRHVHKKAKGRRPLQVDCQKCNASLAIFRGVEWSLRNERERVRQRPPEFSRCVATSDDVAVKFSAASRPRI